MSTEEVKEPNQAATQDLWRIAETNDTNQLESILASGADINASNEHGMTALMRAAARGRLHMVRALLQHGADPNSARNDKFTPLMLAAFFGHQQIVRILVEHGAETNAASRFGTSAQMWATSRTYKDVAQYLGDPITASTSSKAATVPGAEGDSETTVSVASAGALKPGIGALVAANSGEAGELQPPLPGSLQSFTDLTDGQQALHSNLLEGELLNSDDALPEGEQLKYLDALTQFISAHRPPRELMIAYGFITLLLAIAIFTIIPGREPAREVAPSREDPRTSVNGGGVPAKSAPASLPSPMETPKAAASETPASATGNEARNQTDNQNQSTPPLSARVISGLSRDNPGRSARADALTGITKIIEPPAIPAISPEAPREEVRNSALPAATATTTKTQTSVPREPPPTKKSAPITTQMITGPRNPAGNGKVIQWP